MTYTVKLIRTADMMADTYEQLVQEVSDVTAWSDPVDGWLKLHRRVGTEGPSIHYVRVPHEVDLISVIED